MQCFTDPLEPVVASAAVSPAAADSLLELVLDHRLEIAHRLARVRANRGEEVHWLGCVQQYSIFLSPFQAENHSGPPSPVESQLTDILAAMEVYLSDITTPIGNALR